jgi:hypothetical protein
VISRASENGRVVTVMTGSFSPSAVGHKSFRLRPRACALIPSTGAASMLDSTYSDSRDESQKSVTHGEKRSYHRLLGEIDGHTSAGKEEISMARIPSPQPLFSDDSWGLLLVPVVTCLALVVSALLWL